MQIGQMPLSGFCQGSHPRVRLHDHPASQKEPFTRFRQHLRAGAEHRGQHVQPLGTVGQKMKVLLLQVVESERADAFNLAGPSKMIDSQLLASFRHLPTTARSQQAESDPRRLACPSSNLQRKGWLEAPPHRNQPLTDDLGEFFLVVKIEMQDDTKSVNERRNDAV